MLNFDLLKRLQHLFPFKIYKLIHFNFLTARNNSMGLFLLSKTLLFCAPNVGECVLIKINYFCSLLKKAEIQEKAEIQSFPVM